MEMPDWTQQTVSCFLAVSTIQEYLAYAEHVVMRDLGNNSRLQRCGNHLKVTMMEMCNWHHVADTSLHVSTSLTINHAVLGW